MPPEIICHFQGDLHGQMFATRVCLQTFECLKGNVHKKVVVVSFFEATATINKDYLIKKSSRLLFTCIRYTYSTHIHTTYLGAVQDV